MENQFKEIEESFSEIKKQFQRGEISRQDFIDQMKKLRVKDDQGRFWMIGAQSGKWYYFDGKDWVQSEPPSQIEKKAICIYCGFENKLEAEVCARCGGNLSETEKVCPKCGTKLQEPDFICPSCSIGPEKEKVISEESKPGEKAGTYIFRSINPVSFLFFLGTLGAFVGIILGAFAGATAYFSDAVKFLPPALQEFQGKLLGAIIDAGLGGVACFLIFGLVGFIKALFINLILSFMGGIKIALFKAVEKKKREVREEKSDKGFSFDFDLKG